MSGGATGPAVGYTAFNYNKDRPAAASQSIGDVQKAFTGHCHLDNKVPGGNARFAYGRGYILDLSISRKECPHGYPVRMILILRVPMYSVWSPTAFLVRILPANYFASLSIASRMSHTALERVVKIVGPIFRFLIPLPSFPC